jgi:hypothetical protein
LDLDAFLHNVIYSFNKKINKHFNNFGNTNIINISFNNLLDFDPIKNHFKSHVFFYTNRIILDITFKFIAEFNMQLIYDCFYNNYHL